MPMSSVSIFIDTMASKFESEWNLVPRQISSESSDENEMDQLEENILFLRSEKDRKRSNSSLLKRVWPGTRGWIVLLLLFLMSILLYVLVSMHTAFSLRLQPLLNQPSSKIMPIQADKFQSFYNLMADIQSKLSLLYSTNAVKSFSALKRKNISFLLPERVQLSNMKTFELVDKTSNLAATYYERWRLNFPGNKSNASNYFDNVTYCQQVNLIQPFKVKHNNLYWQVVHTTFNDTLMTVYLYNSYYDNRIPGKPNVRVITATDRQVDVEKKQWWCLLWFEGQKSPILSKMIDVYTIWPDKWGDYLEAGIYGPQIFTCDIPSEFGTHIPQAISVQDTHDCDRISLSNVLRVIRNMPEAGFHQASIGICVQALQLGAFDVSVRLVEWLEMVRLMGADRVYFYEMDATENVRKVLRHYELEGLINVRRLTLPGSQVNVNGLYNYYSTKLGINYRPQELVEFNDCLYRNIYRHKYLAVLDIDEMIMPQREPNWHDLIRKVESKITQDNRKIKAYYLNLHSYVYETFQEAQTTDGEQIPDYLYMMQHTYRSELFPYSENVKCFHRTDLVTALHNHLPMRCINTTGHHSCSGLIIDSADSILMHYRRNRAPSKMCHPPTDPTNCTIHDRTAWKHLKLLQLNVKRQLEAIFGQ